MLFEDAEDHNFDKVDNDLLSVRGGKTLKLEYFQLNEFIDPKDVCVISWSSLCQLVYCFAGIRVS